MENEQIEVQTQNVIHFSHEKKTSTENRAM